MQRRVRTTNWTLEMTYVVSMNNHEKVDCRRKCTAHQSLLVVAPMLKP